MSEWEDLENKAPTMIAYLPPDVYEELYYLMGKQENREVTREEFEAYFQDLVFPYLPRVPNDTDHVVVKKQEPKIQVQNKKIEIVSR